MPDKRKLPARSKAARNGGRDGGKLLVMVSGPDQPAPEAAQRIRRAWDDSQAVAVHAMPAPITATLPENFKIRANKPGSCQRRDG